MARINANGKVVYFCNPEHFYRDLPIVFSLLGKISLVIPYEADIPLKERLN